MLLDIRNQFEYDIGHFNQVRKNRVKEVNLDFSGHLSRPAFLSLYQPQYLLICPPFFMYPRIYAYPPSFFFPFPFPLFSFSFPFSLPSFLFPFPFSPFIFSFFPFPLLSFPFPFLLSPFSFLSFFSVFLPIFYLNLTYIISINFDSTFRPKVSIVQHMPNLGQYQTKY